MKNTLLKCLKELEKDTPNISYVRGMLEVLIDREEPTNNKFVREDSGTLIPGTSGTVVQYVDTPPVPTSIGGLKDFIAKSVVTEN